MKSLSTIAAMGFLLLASCAHPMEQVLEEQRQERIGAAYAGRPVTWGAGDGIGYAGQSHASGLTVSDQPRMP